MQIVFDYLTGKVDSDTFKAAFYADPAIGLWLENLIDLKAGPTDEWKKAPYPGYRLAIHKAYDGSFLKFVEYNEAKKKENPRRPIWSDIGWYFETVASIVSVAHPDLKITKFYDQEKDFSICPAGDSTGGSEVEPAIEELLAQFPRSMGQGKRKKAAKAAIRELFHVEGNRVPRWAQSAEWPMGSQRPMKFVGQKKDGEQVLYTFQDVDTEEIRIVEQFY